MTLDTAPTNAFAADILSLLEPIGTDDLTTYLNGATQMHQGIEQIVRATTDIPVAYGRALSIDECPDALLPWFGQFVGVRVTPNTSPDVMRDQIRDVGGFVRGTPAAIIAAVKPTLTGTQTARLFERVGGDPAALLLTVRIDEAPNLTQTESRAQAAKPAGRILTVEATSGRTYAEVEADHAASYATVEALFTTYTDAEENA